MRLKTEVALSAVAAERGRQDTRKAKGRFAFICADKELSPDAKFVILAEEFGEVAREVNVISGRRAPRDAEGTDKALYAELTQVAAVAVAWMESLLETAW